MITKMVAVYDKKTGLFDPPFNVRHVGDAIRQWDIIRKDKETRIGKNPEDFDLFEVGTYEDETGVLNQLKPHTHLADGL